MPDEQQATRTRFASGGPVKGMTSGILEIAEGKVMLSCINMMTSMYTFCTFVRGLTLSFLSVASFWTV
jgi:hypothetical protein